MTTKTRVRRAERLQRNQEKVPTVGATTATTVRAGGQLGTGYAVAVLITALFGLELDSEAFGALVAVLGWAAAFAQNLAENNGWIVSILKRVPQQNVPVVDKA